MHYVTYIMVIIKDNKVTNISKDVEKPKLICTIGRIVKKKKCGHYRKQYGSSFKTLK